MKKLNLDALAVESFVTNEEGEGVRGTVRGNQIFGPYTGMATCVSCDNTRCVNIQTCGGSTCAFTCNCVSAGCGQLSREDCGGGSTDFGYTCDGAEGCGGGMTEH